MSHDPLPPRPADPDHHRAKTTPAGAPAGSLLVVFLTVFIDLLGFGIVLPLVPVYAKQIAVDYRLSPHQVTLALVAIMTSFSVMQLFFSPIWGRLSDRFGRRPILLIGLAGSATFYALLGLSMSGRSLVWLFVSRVGAGICGATIPTAQAYIADVTPAQGRARGMALIGAAFGLGFTFGPLIGALAVGAGSGPEAQAWPGFTAAGLSLIALTLAWFILPESLHPASASASHRRFNWAALREAIQTPSMGLLLTIAFLGVFALANLESTIALTIRALVSAGRAGGWDVSDARQIFLMFTYIGLVQSLMQGLVYRRMAKRITEVPLAVGGAGMAILGFGLLAWASHPACGGLGPLMLAIAVEVTGIGFLSPSIQALISRRSDPDKQGGTLGVAEGLSALGRIGGMAAGLALLERHPAGPFLFGGSLMGLALILVVIAARRGHDYSA